MFLKIQGSFVTTLQLLWKYAILPANFDSERLTCERLWSAKSIPQSVRDPGKTLKESSLAAYLEYMQRVPSLGLDLLLWGQVLLLRWVALAQRGYKPVKD